MCCLVRASLLALFHRVKWEFYVWEPNLGFDSGDQLAYDLCPVAGEPSLKGTRRSETTEEGRYVGVRRLGIEERSIHFETPGERFQGLIGGSCCAPLVQAHGRCSHTGGFTQSALPNTSQITGHAQPLWREATAETPGPVRQAGVLPVPVHPAAYSQTTRNAWISPELSLETASFVVY